MKHTNHAPKLLRIGLAGFLLLGSGLAFGGEPIPSEPVPSRQEAPVLIQAQEAGRATAEQATPDTGKILIAWDRVGIMA
jgi:hypothetical protein